MFKRRAVAVMAAVVMVWWCGASFAASRGDVARRLEDFRKYFVDFQYAPDNAIPGELLADCYGVIIMRQYKAGFVFGGKGGDGVIFMHDRFTGEWSPPAFVRSAEASWGFQIGGQAIDAIILIMNQAGVDMLLKTRFSIGVDASAAAGPVGRDMSAAVGAGTALLTYSRTKGLFAGASFQGGAMFNHDSYNEAMYGMKIGIREILMERRVGMPREAVPMVETLKSYAVRNVASPEPYIPERTQSGLDRRPTFGGQYDNRQPQPPRNYNNPPPQPSQYEQDKYTQAPRQPVDRRPAYEEGGSRYAAPELPPLDYEQSRNPAPRQPSPQQRQLEEEARRAALAAEDAAAAARRAAAAAEDAARRAEAAREGW